MRLWPRLRWQAIEPEASHRAHPAVPHPRELITGTLSRHDRVLDWLAAHVLASRLMFDAALILPLLVLPMSTAAKVTLGVISGSWIQWWALPALQRQGIAADRQRAAKADADHQALTHLAAAVDDIRAALAAAPGKDKA